MANGRLIDNANSLSINKQFFVKENFRFKDNDDVFYLIFSFASTKLAETKY